MTKQELYEQAMQTMELPAHMDIKVNMLIDLIRTATLDEVEEAIDKELREEAESVDPDYPPSSMRIEAVEYGVEISKQAIDNLRGTDEN